MMIKLIRPIRSHIHRKIIEVIRQIGLTKEDHTINLNVPIRSPIYGSFIGLIGPIGALEGIGVPREPLLPQRLFYCN